MKPLQTPSLETHPSKTPSRVATCENNQIISGQTVENTLQLNKQGGGRIDIPLPESGLPVINVIEENIEDFQINFTSTAITTSSEANFKSIEAIRLSSSPPNFTMYNDDSISAVSNRTGNYLAIKLTKEGTSERTGKPMNAISINIPNQSTPIGLENGTYKVQIDDFNMYFERAYTTKDMDISVEFSVLNGTATIPNQTIEIPGGVFYTTRSNTDISNIQPSNTDRFLKVE